MKSRIISVLIAFVMAATMIPILGEKSYAEETAGGISSGGFELSDIKVSNPSPKLGETIKISYTLKVPNDKKITDIQWTVQRGGAGDCSSGNQFNGSSYYQGTIEETVIYYGTWQLNYLSVTCADGTSAVFYDSSNMTQEEFDGLQHDDNEYYINMSGSKAIVQNSPNPDDNQDPIIHAESARVSKVEGKLNENFRIGIKISDNVGLIEVYPELSLGKGGVCAYGQLFYNNQTGYWEGDIHADYYGTYEIVSIRAVDSSGNETTVYNSKYSKYTGETPAGNMSAANHYVKGVNDTTPPTINFGTLGVEKSEIGLWKSNKVRVKITDNTQIQQVDATVKRGAGYLCSYGGAFQYNRKNGYYEFDLTGQFYGNWEIMEIRAVDVYGNKTVVYNSNCVDGKNPLAEYGEEGAIHRDLSAAAFYVGIEDTKTDIFVSGDGMDNSATLDTQKRKYQGTDYKKLNNSKHKDIGYFNIKMGGNYVKGGKNVRTRFEPENVVDGNIVTIKHLLSNGSIQKKTCRVKNGQIDIHVDEFSPFLLEMDSSLKENKNYSIKYVLNKGKNNKSNPTIYYSVSDTIKLKSPTRKGYDFKGWYLDKKYKKKITAIKKGTSGNKTLYARWVKTKISTPKSVKATAGKKKLTVKYKSIKGAKGYVIKYSLKKSMKSSKSVTVKSNKYTIKKLKAKKKYYIQVRSYKLDSTGKRVYSKWSKVKSKKTK